MGSSYENIAIIGYGKIVAWVIKYIYDIKPACHTIIHQLS